MANRDILWKGLLEWVFEDLVRFVYPASDELIDWKAPVVFMDKELAALVPGPADEMTVRVVDKLVKVRLKKRKAGAYVHVEVQGRTEKLQRRAFGERMFHYFRLVRGKYSGPLAAIAIYSGGDGHLFPKSYSCSLMNTRLQYKFERINVGEYSDEELAASDNRFAWALLIAKQALLSGKNWKQRLLEKKWMIFRLLYENGLFQDRKLQGLLVFMKHYIPFDDPEISRIFEERCDSLTGKTKTMDIFEQVAQMQLEEARRKGFEEGRKLGLEKARQERERLYKESVVRELLVQSDFSNERIAAIVKVPVERVAAIRDEMRS